MEVAEHALLGGRVRLREAGTGRRAGHDAGQLAAAVPARAGEVARRAVDDLQRSIPHAVEDARQGQVVPTLTKDAARAADAVREGTRGAAGSAPGAAGSVDMSAGPGAPESIP